MLCIEFSLMRCTELLMLLLSLEAVLDGSLMRKKRSSTPFFGSSTRIKGSSSCLRCNCCLIT